MERKESTSIRDKQCACSFLGLQHIVTCGLKEMTTGSDPVSLGSSPSESTITPAERGELKTNR